MTDNNKTLLLNLDEQISFINSQLTRLKDNIEMSISISVKDLADYHRFAESLVFLVKSRQLISKS